MHLLFILLKGRGTRPLLRRDNSRRSTRQDSRELRNIIHLMGLTGTLSIPHNTSPTGTGCIIRNTIFTRRRV